LRDGSGLAHEIVVCGCPVCHQAGANKLITAFAVALSRDREQSEPEVKIRLRMARLDGVCTQGPEIAIDGVRHSRFQGAHVLPIIRELRGTECREAAEPLLRTS